MFFVYNPATKLWVGLSYLILSKPVHCLRKGYQLAGLSNFNPSGTWSSMFSFMLELQGLRGLFYLLACVHSRYLM